MADARPDADSAPTPRPAWPRRRPRKPSIEDHLVPLKQATLVIADTLAQLPDFDLLRVLGRGLQFVPFPVEERLPDFHLPSVLRTIVDQIRMVSHAAFAVLAVGPPPDAAWREFVGSGLSADQTTAFTATPGLLAALTRVAAEGRVTCVPDIRREEAFAGVAPTGGSLHNLLSVGIFYQSQVVGTLFLFNTDRPGGFTAEDEQSVELLAAHAGIAIQQAYLFASLETQRDQLQVILESVRDGIIYVAKDSRRIVANPAAHLLFGRTLVPEAGEAQILGMLCTPGGRPLQQEELPSERTFQGDHRESEELLIHRPDGRQIPVQVQSAPVSAGVGVTAGVVVVYQDVSASRREEMLRKEYVALTSHDLRSPLTVIRMQAQLAQQLLAAPDVDHGRVTKSLASIERNSRYINSLIQDMLDVSQLEAGLMELQLRPTDLPMLVSASIDQAVAPEERSRIQVHPCGDLPQALADGEKISRVMVNLLTNAVKYSPPGTPVDVAFTVADGHVVVSTSSHGKGIVPQELDRLFHKFYRSTSNDHTEGRGLGLYISRLLLEAHGGRIWATSQGDLGTTFSFSLPVS